MTEEKLDTETDILRAEYRLKKLELQQKKRNDAKAWQRVVIGPLAVGAVVAVMSGLAALYVENVKLEAAGENEKFAREHQLLLAADQLNRPDRRERMCLYAFSNSFLHPESRAILYDFIENDAECTPVGIVLSEAKTIQGNDEFQSCLGDGVPQSASCQAYDKSGFHSRPRGSCSITLVSGEERFFASKRVRVVDEFYRRLEGPSALEAILPVEDDLPVRTFSGRISCTNSAGTGRTCEARATVQQTSYPNRCLPFLEQLAEN